MGQVNLNPQQVLEWQYKLKQIYCDQINEKMSTPSQSTPSQISVVMEWTLCVMEWTFYLKMYFCVFRSQKDICVCMHGCLCIIDLWNVIHRYTRPSFSTCYIQYAFSNTINDIVHSVTLLNNAIEYYILNFSNANQPHHPQVHLQ